MNLPVELTNDNRTQEKEIHQVVNKEKSAIDSLEKSVALYRELSDKIITYKKEIRDIRVETARLKGVKEKLQLPSSSVVSSEAYGNGFSIENQVDISNKEIDNNNNSIRKETCGEIIRKAETIKNNILDNRIKAEEAIEPLERSVQLLKVQIEYTRNLEKSLLIFDKKKQAEEKIKESNEIVLMLADQLN